MPLVTKIAVLITLSAILALVTRRSLTSLHLHGPYRLIAWVAAIALILQNVEYWFDDPTSASQLVSWLSLLISVSLVVYGALSLKRGCTGSKREDGSLMGIEKTTELVMTGAYRYVRHPIYGSFLPGSVGVFLKDVSWPSGSLMGIVIVATFLAARM